MDWVKKIEIEDGILGIGELNKPLADFLSAFHFSTSEKKIFETFILEKRKKEFLAIRLVAEELLHEKTEIIYDGTGRPSLKDNPLNISISHSNELVAVLISKRKIGVDAENINRAIEKVSTRFLSERELEYAKNQKEPRGTMILFWSTKEAVFKCSGREKILFNHDIIVQTESIGENKLFYAQLIKEEIKTTYCCRSFLFKNNVVVYCVEEDNKVKNK